MQLYHYVYQIITNYYDVSGQSPSLNYGAPNCRALQTDDFLVLSSHFEGEQVRAFRLISRAGNERVGHLNKGKTSSFNYSGIVEGH